MTGNSYNNYFFHLLSDNLPLMWTTFARKSLARALLLAHTHLTSTNWLEGVQLWLKKQHHLCDLQHLNFLIKSRYNAHPMGLTDIKSIENYWDFHQPTIKERTEETSYSVMGKRPENPSANNVEMDESSLIAVAIKFTTEEWKILLDKVFS